MLEVACKAPDGEIHCHDDDNPKSSLLHSDDSCYRDFSKLTTCNKKNKHKAEERKMDNRFQKNVFSSHKED
jgi:hypothetical protein